MNRLHTRLRVRARRDAQPSAALVDSQSVKAADTVGAGSRGFDSGKKINGRKRHLAVDVEGFLLAVVVTAANIGDRMGAKLLGIAVLNICTRLRLIWADSGYDGAPLARWIRSVAGATLQNIKRTEHHEAMVYWATVLVMTRRLARRHTDPPINQRWGQPRTVASGPEPAPT